MSNNNIIIKTNNLSYEQILKLEASELRNIQDLKPYCDTISEYFRNNISIDKHNKLQLKLVVEPVKITHKLKIAFGLLLDDFAGSSKHQKLKKISDSAYMLKKISELKLIALKFIILLVQIIHS